MKENDEKEPVESEEIAIPDNKANLNLMNQIHGLVATQIINTLKKKTITPQDLAQAIKFLKDNNVQVDPEFSKSIQDAVAAFDSAKSKVDTKTLPFPVKA